MDEADLLALIKKIADVFIEDYATWCNKAPKMIVLSALTGAFAASAAEAGAARENVIAALNSAFDDIEEKRPK